MVDSPYPSPSPRHHAMSLPLTQRQSMRLEPRIICIYPSSWGITANINDTAVWTTGKHSQSSAPTSLHLASMSARQSSVSTNVHPGSSGNVRLLLLLCEQAGPTRKGNHRPHVATAIRHESTAPIPSSRPRDALARFEAGLAPPGSFAR
jgi:hypothetical protein